LCTQHLASPTKYLNKGKPIEGLLSNGFKNRIFMQPMRLLNIYTHGGSSFFLLGAEGRRGGGVCSSKGSQGFGEGEFLD
jgi:hypothetical protein